MRSRASEKGLHARRLYNQAVVTSHRAWTMRVEALEMRLRVRSMRERAHSRG